MGHLHGPGRRLLNEAVTVAVAGACAGWVSGQRPLSGQGTGTGRAEPGWRSSSEGVRCWAQAGPEGGASELGGGLGKGRGRQDPGPPGPPGWVEG